MVTNNITTGIRDGSSCVHVRSDGQFEVRVWKQGVWEILRSNVATQRAAWEIARAELAGGRVYLTRDSDPAAIELYDPGR